MKLRATLAVTVLLVGVGWAQQDSKKAATSPASATSSTTLPELKTQTYRGTLLDASCAQQQTCTVSESTKEFALKTKEGQTLRFDSVGNERAQEAVKNKKSWREAILNKKPINAKVSAHLEGDKLTVVTVN